MTYLDQGLDELLHHLWLATLRLVRMNWPAVRALATALLERETLDGDAVRAIIQGSRP
jgi:ATP-dependent Zn protease